MNKEKVKEFFGDIRQHLMTGISYMMPVIIIFALFMVLSQIPGELQPIMQLLSEAGALMMVPLLATFIAFSIAGKLAIAPTIVLTLMSDQLGMGFLGGLIVGLMAGYMVKLIVHLINKLPASQIIDIIVSFLVVPIFVPLLLGLFIYFVIASPITGLVTGITAWLNSMSGTNSILLAVILGAMIAVDMGGPINKTAFAFAIAAYTEGAYEVSAPVLVAISIPTLAMALAPILAPKKYTFEEKSAGKSAIVLGLIGLTEGAIPFAAVDPFRVIPAIIIGSSLGAGLTAIFGISNSVMIPSVIGMSGVNKLVPYLLIHVFSVMVTALIVNVLKKEVSEEDR